MRSFFIIAGHSGKAEPGAKAFDGTYEADHTLEVRNLVVEHLQRLGGTTLALRGTVMQDPDNESLQSTINTLNRIGKADDFALDIHFNDNHPTATGVECFVNDGTSEANRLLAGNLVNAVSKVLGLPNRGIKSETQTYIYQKHGWRLGILHAKPRVVLLEICFLNSRDLPVFYERKDQVAEAIARTIIQAYPDVFGQRPQG